MAAIRVHRIEDGTIYREVVLHDVEPARLDELAANVQFVMDADTYYVRVEYED